MSFTDQTHEPSIKSWIESANDSASDFPIQNLPFGVFRPRGATSADARIGVAIGEMILDLRGCVEAKLCDSMAPEAQCALCAASLNDLLKLGPEHWRAVRRRISDLLRSDTATIRDHSKLRAELLVPQVEAEMLMPARIGDYTDFYASLHHATNVGSMFRPDNPLMPNWKHLPVGYHGRASSIVMSGTPIRRPMGQTKADDAALPEFGPCKLLDYEMEMGFFVGPGNALGERVTMAQAAERIFGMVLVNDWSARDVQKWEYQPLGPFNAKNFATTIGSWVVTLDALAPYRVAGPPRAKDDPPTIDYLQPNDDASKHMGIELTCEVYLASRKMRESRTEPMRISRGGFADMYWTMAQMLVHHASTGCNMQPGDMLASGTVSGPSEEARGCLLERTWRGQHPIDLPDGTQRKFLLDGDEVILKAFCEKEGAARIGFGTCRGVIEPAK